VHGLVVESLRLFGGQWWCSAWPWVRIFYFWGQWSWVRIDFWGPVDRGVVHGRGIESLNFGVNGGVVYGRGLESLTFWVNGGV
jgi:hypothetical protein